MNKKDLARAKEEGNYDVTSINNAEDTDVKRFLKRVLDMSLYTKSQVIDKIRKCNVCPLRPVQIGQKLIHKCMFWEEDREDCPVGKANFVSQCKELVRVEQLGMKEYMKYLAVRNASRSVIAGQVEMMTKGHEGYYALEFDKLALDAAEKVLKYEEGEKLHITANVDHSVSLSDIRKKFFDDSDSQKIIEVEIKEVGDDRTTDEELKEKEKISPEQEETINSFKQIKQQYLEEQANEEREDTE